MSGTSLQKRLCQAKRRYPTELAAIHAALLLSRNQNKPTRTYLCLTCRGWHVTSKIER